MASVEVSKKDLEKLMGMEIVIPKLEEDLFDEKMELDHYDDKTETLVIETEYDRPDLLSAEGIARQLRLYYGKQKGLIKYDFKPAKARVRVSKEMKKYRPYAHYFIAKNVRMTEELVKQLMQIQEKLHEVYAGNRKLASIGVYDFDKTKPDYEYKPVKPKEIKFTPLGETTEMNGIEVLEKTEKGREFAWLLEGKDKYPLLVDSTGRVLSMPPILNSEDTKVDENTHNLFVDVTGTDEKTVRMITVILATMLAERRASIEKVIVEEGSKKFETPITEYEEKTISVELVNKMLGLELSQEEVVKLFEKQGFDAKKKGKQVKVTIPCYRFDILHEADLVEEVACAYGLNSMKPKLPNVFTIGEKHKIEKTTDVLRELMIGLGFQEIATFILSNSKSFEEKVRVGEKILKLKNPMSEEYDCLRNTLIPKLLEFLSKNKHYELPQKVFEAGDVVVFTNKGEEKTRTEKRIAGVIISADAGFTQAKSFAESILRNIGVKPEFEAKNYDTFIIGRSAEIKHGKKVIGIIGEIHPQIITDFELENPIAVFELRIDELL